MFAVWKGTTPREKCPARDAVCHRCQKKGHYGACCLTKIDEVASDHCCTCGNRNVDTISTIQGLSLESTFLDTIEDTRATTWATTWATTVKPNNVDVLFKLDTRAEVSAITVETYQKLNVKLVKPLKTLYGPSQATLTVNRQFEGKLEHQGKQTIQLVYVIQNLKRNLLGLPAIKAFNLVVKVDSMSKNTQCMEDQYKPHWQYLESFKELNAKFKLKQKTAYDRHHRTRSLSPIPEEEEVWVTSGQSTTSGQVRSQADTPCSYIVNTPQGPIRRNRCHLRVVPNSSNTNAVHQDGTNPLGTVNPTMEYTQQDSCNPSRTVTRSMTGTATPDRLRF